MSNGPQIVKLSILQATNGKTELRNGAKPEDNAIGVVQEAHPDGTAEALRRTPPSTAGANAVECSIIRSIVTEAAREPGEAAAIGGSGIGGIP